MPRIFGRGAAVELPSRTIIPPVPTPGRSGAAPGHGGIPPGHGGIPPGHTDTVVPVVSDVGALNAFVTIAQAGAGASPSAGSFATPAFVQGTMNGGGTSQTVAFLSNVTAGNLLIAFANCTPQVGKTITGVSDSQGTTYTLAGGLQAGWFSSLLGIWYAIALSSGACTITFATDGTGFQLFTGLGCHEVSGIDTGNPLRATAFGHVFPATTGADATTVGPVAVGLKDYIFAYVGDDDSGNFAAGSAFTARERQQQGSVRNGIQSEDAVAAVAGTVSPTFTLTTADHIDLGAATFRPRPL